MTWVISDKDKFIFIWIDKNGGTSISKYLQTIYGNDSPGLDANNNVKKEFEKNKNIIFINNNGLKPHYSPRRYALEIMENLNLEGQWENYFKFAFVRNPWDRVVSFYSEIINAEKSYWPSKINYRQKICELMNIKTKELTFEIFLKCCLIEQKFKNYHLEPQYYKICNLKDKIIVDFVGRYENFNNDLEFIFNKLNLDISSFPHHNKSNHKYYGEYYNDDTQRIVEKYYKKDIEMFDYHFRKQPDKI